MNIEKTILITAANAPLARSIAALLSPHGVDMFTVPLYDSSGIIQYYISSGWIDSQFAALLSDANLLYAASNSVATLSQCQNLISTGIVSDAKPHALIAGMGLSLDLKAI